jgi:hypothetical protein
MKSGIIWKLAQKYSLPVSIAGLFGKGQTKKLNGV